MRPRTGGPWGCFLLVIFGPLLALLLLPLLSVLGMATQNFVASALIFFYAFLIWCIGHEVWLGQMVRGHFLRLVFWIVATALIAWVGGYGLSLLSQSIGGLFTLLVFVGGALWFRRDVMSIARGFLVDDLGGRLRGGGMTNAVQGQAVTVGERRRASVDYSRVRRPGAVKVEDVHSAGQLPEGDESEGSG